MIPSGLPHHRKVSRLEEVLSTSISAICDCEITIEDGCVTVSITGDALSDCGGFVRVDLDVSRLAEELARELP